MSDGRSLTPPPRANVDDRRNIHGAILKGLLLNKLTCGSPSISVIDHNAYSIRFSRIEELSVDESRWIKQLIMLMINESILQK